MASLSSTLSQTNLEPEQEPCKEDRGLIGIPRQAPCLFARVFVLNQQMQLFQHVVI